MGDCPECGLVVRESIASIIDPAVHHMPGVNRPRLVANGLRVFMLLMTLSFLAGVLASMLTQAFIEWFGYDTTMPGAWSGGVRDVVYFGTLLGEISPYLAIASLFGLLAMGPLAVSGQPGKSKRILLQLEIGVLCWIVAMFFLDTLGPGQGLGPLSRGATGIGEPGTWFIQDVLLALSPLVGGWVTLLGIRSLYGEIGRRSRRFRTATTKRQKVLDILWATLFWATGILVQFIGAGAGLSTLVTFGSVLRLIAGFLVLIGIIYLLVNTFWIARSLDLPPPRLRELLGEPTGSKAGE